MNLNFDFSQFVEDFESSCQKVQIKHFSKNEVITSYIAKRNQFCILLNGNADLVRYDLNGNRTIVEHFSKNDEMSYCNNYFRNFFICFQRECYL